MQYFQYVTAIFCLFIGNPIFSQYSLSGKITDKTDETTIPGVSIYLPEAKIGAVSDTNGVFTLSHLKKGIYLIEIKSMGYKPLAKKIEIKKDTIINFSLDLSATELNEVIVTGVTRSTELKRNPIIAKTMGRKGFEQNSATNLIDALKTIPGVNEITNGPNISKPIIRGLGYNRVITLHNGIKQEGQQWGDEHGIEIDEYAIDRVEIIKGPGSLIYGSDGIAGVINFLSPKPPLTNEIKTKILANYQSNNHFLGHAISNAGNKNDFQWLANFTHKMAGNYQNKYDGRVLNSGFKELDGKISLGIHKNWGHSFLTFDSYNTQLGIVEGERDSWGNFTYENQNGESVSATQEDLKSYRLKIPYQFVHHLSITSGNYFILNKGTISADIAFQNNSRKEFEDAESPENVGLSLSLNTFNYNFRYHFNTIKGWETSIGIGGMLQNNTNKGIEFLIPDYQLLDAGSFLYTQKNWKNWTFAGGLRWDNRVIIANELFLDENESPIQKPDSTSNLKFTHFNNYYSGISGSAGLAYQINHNATFKINLSRGFRTPNIAELSSNGKHEGTFRYEIGNLNLKPEISHQLDIAFYLNSEHISLEISPFINFITHYSFLEKLKDSLGNDVIIDTNDPISTFQYTAGKAMLSGGEIYIDWHPHPLDWLHLENSFSYVRATLHNIADSTQYLPFIPAPQYRGGIKAEWNNLHEKISSVFIKFNVEHYFAQNNIYSAFETETMTPRYTLLGAGIGIVLNTWKNKEGLSFFINGNNLMDTAYQNHLSRLKYAGKNPLTGRKGVFNMGRNFSIKMIVNI